MELKKNKLVTSSAFLISVILHLVLILIVGGMVALKFYKKEGAGFVVENQKPKLERRKLQLPVKTEPFMEQMSKPKQKTSSRITANSPQMINIPEQGSFVKMAPVPTFKGGYTNFIQIDRTLEFNSKYRTVDFGESAVDFFGTRGKAEKVVIVMDTSKSMLYDSQGGADSYLLVHEDLKNVINEMRSATLFNLVLFDGSRVATFSRSMLPATPTAKTNVLEWVGGVNTNLAQVGLNEAMVNYKPQRRYDIPMDAEDLTGWLKGMEAALEMKPEIIFLLGSDWGSVSTAQGISYFKRKAAFRAYQKRRANYFLENEDAQEEMEEYMLQFEQYRAAALKMLELENQAREEEMMQPKVVRDWDDILVENDEELLPPPMVDEEDFPQMSAADIRYTFDEVLESLFVIGMENYLELGFPRINFVLMTPRTRSANTTEGASMMTSATKFDQLRRMLRGRIRNVPNVEPISNLLEQNLSDILRELEEGDTDVF